MSQLYLSPSRAADFKNCPQLYKYRSVDRLPEPPSRPATIGSIVHLALQFLFDEAPAHRVPDLSEDLVDRAWPDVVTTDVADTLFGTDAAGVSAARDEAAAHVRNYFLLEDPRRLEPVGRELRLEVALALPAPRRRPSSAGDHPDDSHGNAHGGDGETSVHVVGVLDRVDRRVDGTFVVSDYKTGRVPDLGRSLPSFFGLKVYALLLEQALGVTPERLRLLYLKGPETIVYEPGDNDLVAIAGQLGAIGAAVRRANDEDDWRPRPSRLCDYCAFRAICPAHVDSRPPAPVDPAGAATAPEHQEPAVPTPAASAQSPAGVAAP